MPGGKHSVGIAECYVWVKGDVDALHADFASRGALQLHPVADRLYADARLLVL